jgi:hypothetical protein
MTPPPRDRGQTLELPLSSPQTAPSAPVANPLASTPTLTTTSIAPARSEPASDKKEEPSSPERESDNAA